MRRRSAAGIRPSGKGLHRSPGRRDAGTSRRGEVIAVLTAPRRRHGRDNPTNLQNAYQHFRATRSTRFTDRSIPVPTVAKSAGPNRPETGEKPDEARHGDRGNHEARGYRNPLRLSG